MLKGKEGKTQQGKLLELNLMEKYSIKLDTFIILMKWISAFVLDPSYYWWSIYFSGKKINYSLIIFIAGSTLTKHEQFMGCLFHCFYLWSWQTSRNIYLKVSSAGFNGTCWSVSISFQAFWLKLVSEVSSTRGGGEMSYIIQNYRPDLNQFHSIGS